VTRLPDPGFWAGKRVLVTGHTGFKGSWAALWLAEMGAEVTGFALAPEGAEHHYGLARIGDLVASRIGDLSERPAVAAAVRAARPDLVVHMAAQALVRRALADPLATWQTNVTGTGHLLAALGEHAPEAVTLVVTSDKVYRNDDTGRAFVETDPLGGKDPYSASKAAAELMVASWRASYPGAPLATARGGNVIGGGDFAEDRILPDIVRAARAGEPAVLRHPEAIRPWQHVLDCLSGYLLHLEALAAGADLPALNIGPAPEPATTVGAAATRLAAGLGAPGWRHAPEARSVEARRLALDASAARAALGWGDRLSRDRALGLTAEWYRAWLEGADMAQLSRGQLRAYLEGSA